MIWIRIVSKDGVPASTLALGVPLAARFGDSVGDLGRGVGCTLVLPDANREISRKQALITCQAGRHFIRPIGTNLDVRLNGRQLPADAESPLDIGSEIRIGPYVMRVEPEPGEAPAKSAPPAQAAPVPARRLDDPRDFAVPAARAAPVEAFDDMLKAQNHQPRPASAPQQAAAPPRTPAPEKPKAAPPAAPPGQAPVAKPPAPPSRAAAPANANASDEKARKDAAAERATPNDEMVKAVYSGLGMATPPAAERTAQRMQLIGELLRESLAGTLGLLAARTISKRELGAGATMLQTRGNNPLKFSPNVDAALTHLLGPPMRGFIGAGDAVRDAFGDLRAHQVAILAGMRAALEAVLERFDPVALEARLAPRGMWEHLMPVNRRAKLWEQFGEQYAEILREAEDDFDSLFGNAFLQAYEAQLAELARAPTVEGDGES